MDILDVHIVRIKDHDEETNLSLDLLFAVDHPTYPPIPKYVSWRDMVVWIVYVIFNQKIYTVKGVDLRADVPFDVAFPTEYDTDYVIIPAFVHSETQVGLTITNETSTGFTITANGMDCLLDFTVIPITPIPS